MLCFVAGISNPTRILKGEFAGIQRVLCQWSRSHTLKFKASTVTHPTEFLYPIWSTDGFISGDLHSECQDGTQETTRT